MDRKKVFLAYSINLYALFFLFSHTMIFEKGNKKLSEFGIHYPVKEKIKNYGVESMKIKAEKAFKLEDGKHTGKIEMIEYKEKPYAYTELHIKEDESKLVLRCGVPSKLTENSALGQILSNFGANITKLIDKDVEIEDYINAGQSVSFMTLTEKTERGTFAKIIASSIRPL